MRSIFQGEALKLHYLRWVLFDIGNEKYFMYQMTLQISGAIGF